MDSAHSRVRCDGSLPMSLMKYQYLVLEEASIIRFEINVEYMWEDVLKPTATSRFS